MLLWAFASAQKIQTIVPGQSIVIGTAFQVQYIIIDPSGLAGLSEPAFRDFTLVSGPNHYKGKTIVNDKLQEIENITYTLVPLKTGNLTVPGLRASFEYGPVQESEDVMITVIPKPKLSFLARSSYTDAALYAPSSRSDLDKLVNENIFIKTEVSKKNCYVGEPVIASFKLYSRLQSTSELVRVPGLYGFSVIDILDIKESHQDVETIDGKVYNTSILRKVQLYPELPGQLVIDEMVVKNEIEFDDSLDNDKKTLIQKELRSRPVVVTVKPLPGKHPDNYSGAVGNFSISSRLVNDQLSVNEQGKLELTVTGSGNFIQLGEPVIQWPEGIEVFDPVIRDELNTSSVPASGSRTYVYGFSSDSVAHYAIPAVSFSYFDPAKDSFQKISTRDLPFHIVNAATSKILDNRSARPGSTPGKGLLVGIILAVLGFLILILVRKKKKYIPQPIVPAKVEETISTRIGSLDIHQLNEKEACIQVNKLLSELERRFPRMNNQQKQELVSIKNDCQFMAYSSMELKGRKESLHQRALELARSVEADYSAYL